jgi:hypothetical protein
VVGRALGGRAESLAKRKCCHRQPELPTYPLDKPRLLPSLAGFGAQPHQDVIRAKAVNRLGDGADRGVIAYGATGLDTGFLQLTENRLKTLVGLVSGAVGFRSEPLEAPWQRWREDEDFRSGIEQDAHERRKLIDGGSDRPGRHEKPPSVGDRHHVGDPTQGEFVTAT